MNVFNKLTLQSLKKNKTRTIVTIIGIMLSAALICAVTTFTSSMQKFALDSQVYVNGDWHASVNSVTTEEYEKISNDERVSQCVHTQNLGYAKIESENKYKPYINVVAGENEYFDMVPVHLVSGRLPQNSNEIVLSEQFYEDGNSGFKTGDTVTLEIGERIYDGTKLGQQDRVYTYDADINEEVFVPEEFIVDKSRTYTIVGVYEKSDYSEDYKSPGYTAFTIVDEKPAQDAQLDVYYKMNKPAQVYSFSEEMGFDATYNRDVLMCLGVSSYDSFFMMFVSLAVIIIILIVLGSVSLIYNTFSISVSERTKQFGLLSSIGATKKQLKKMVLFEAFAVSAIGIPLGILVGIGGISITLMLIGHKFNSMAEGVPVSMRICVTWQSVAIAAVIAIVTVLISAWIPSIRATKVSAIEAIRQSEDITIKRKQVKTSKLIYKLFGLPGVLSVKHFKRNKKKYRSTVISLFMSVVLFVSASAFTEYLVDSTKASSMISAASDLTYIVSRDQLNGKNLDEVLDLIKTGEYVTKATYARNISVHGDVNKEYVSDQFIESYSEKAANPDYVSTTCVLYFVDDAEFKSLLKENNLNEEDFYNSDAPVAVAQNGCTFYDEEQEKYVTLDIVKGDECEVTFAECKYIDGYMDSRIIEKDGQKWVEYCSNNDVNDVIRMPYDEYVTEYTFKSVKTIEDTALFIDTSKPVLNFVYPMSMMDQVLPESGKEKGDFYTFYIDLNDHAAGSDNIQRILSQNGLSTENFYNPAEGNEMSKNLVSIVQVFAYGFVIIISLISVANVFNTISTNIALRRREFAMLKSVGMTQKDFNKMMNFECLLYGAKALSLGLPVSFLVTYIIYRVIAQGYGTYFHLPWNAIAIATLSVFLVVFVTMMYAMRKIKKDNPIEALKNENC